MSLSLMDSMNCLQGEIARPVLPISGFSFVHRTYDERKNRDLTNGQNFLHICFESRKAFQPQSTQALAALASFGGLMENRIMVMGGD